MLKEKSNVQKYGSVFVLKDDVLSTINTCVLYYYTMNKEQSQEKFIKEMCLMYNLKGRKPEQLHKIL